MNNISWQAPEFLEHDRTTVWYVAVGIVSALLIAYAIYSKSIITIITFAMLIGVGFIFSGKKPRLVDHTLTSSGIEVGNMLYPYKNIRKFWIIYNPPEVKTLNFETTAYLNPMVTLQLGSQDPVEVKLFLKNYLPEDLETEESMTDLIARKIKF